MLSKRLSPLKQNHCLISRPMCFAIKLILPCVQLWLRELVGATCYSHNLWSKVNRKGELHNVSRRNLHKLILSFYWLLVSQLQYLQSNDYAIISCLLQLIALLVSLYSFSCLLWGLELHFSFSSTCPAINIAEVRNVFQYSKDCSLAVIVSPSIKASTSGRADVGIRMNGDQSKSSTN